MSAPSLFTPNVDKGGRSGLRFRPYRHGASQSGARGLFSIVPNGEQFVADVERDDCGAGCRCAAFITPIDETGALLLLDAAVIDSQCKVVREARAAWAGAPK